MVFVQGMYIYHTYTIVCGALLTIVLSAHHIYTLIKKHTRLISEPSFWICLGLLLFYGVTLPLMLIINFPYKEYSATQYLILNYIQLLPNYILYPMFAIALLIGRRKLKSIKNDEV